MGKVLCSPTLQLPLLVNDLLHMPAGYQNGCVVLQRTCAVFFRLHLCVAHMWWQLIFLGCPRWERQQLIDRMLLSRRSSVQAGSSVSGQANSGRGRHQCSTSPRDRDVVPGPDRHVASSHCRSMFWRWHNAA